MIAIFIYFSEGLSAGGIAGIVIGILLPLILISVLRDEDTKRVTRSPK
jgi:hypothetical protein